MEKDYQKLKEHCNKKLLTKNKKTLKTYSTILEVIKENEYSIIDILISKLQVYNYKIIINNNNIGNFHNIDIYRFVPANIKLKFFNKDYFVKKHIRHYCLMLPEEKHKLIDILEKLLKEVED